MNILLPEPVRMALDLLEGKGFQAYAVGGCVRDRLLDMEPFDWNIATSALPCETAECFSGCARVMLTGAQLGTVSVILGGMRMEATTFRVDGDYSDTRRPDRVRFTGDIREDLRRRDFTVNAMAYHPRRGLVDPFGGYEDTKAGVLRCLGDPDARLSQDALRILRALRFMSQRGFTMEKKTGQAVLRCRELLRQLSAQRIAGETERLLCGAGVGAVLRQYHAVLEVFMPELAPMVGFRQRNPYHLYDVFEHTVRVVENVVPVREVRLAALLHDCGKPDCFSVDERGIGHFYGHPAHSVRHARDILGRLKYDKRTIELVCALIEHHDAYIPPEEKTVRRLLSRLGPERTQLLLELKKGDCIGQGVSLERVESLREAQRVAAAVVERGECLTLADMAVDGKDLIGIGAPRGPYIGRLLDELLNRVIEGTLKNERGALLDASRELLSDPRLYT